ncbi:hypothetical protein ACIF6L_34270 [Kitasatospora sp. NPDC086009]|uniref:hypothetical protein n=1 Tax=unclassified Kitasatospora TaxID=2633591 RepID=UPI0037C75EBD
MATAQHTPPPTTARTVPAHVIRHRATTERLAHATAAVATAIGPQLDDGPWSHLGAWGALGAGCWWLYRKATSSDGDEFGLLRSCQRALPLLGYAGLYTAGVVQSGSSWWELAGPAAWGALMAWWAPITRAAGLVPEALPPAPVPQQPAAPPTPAGTVYEPGYPGLLARMWDTAGHATGTRLTAVRQYADDRPDFQAVIVAQQGKVVPKVDEAKLAGTFDFPAGTVTLTPINGSGPGRMLLTARPTLAAEEQAWTFERLWAEKVAADGGAAPGMHLVDHRTEPNRIVVRVEAAEGRLVELPQRPIARALGIKDHDLVVVETDGLGDGVVSFYEEHPLIDIRCATVEDLTMDADGRIQLGLRHDGRPARLPLYDPALGAVTDLFVGAPGAGKSVTLNTIIASERISGVVSIVADAQDGMSLPEANGRVYHFGAGIAAVGATLAAVYAVAKYRQKVSSENGWGAFEIGKPWRLVNLTLDELNLILAADADVQPDFKKWVVGNISAFQSTGRKMGKGIRFAAQSIHLEDLGDKDKIRANAKNGTVSLGRTNSSTTQHMAADGVLPPGMRIEPIPRYFRAADAIDAAFKGEEAARGPVTAGVAWLIQGGQLYKARTFKAVKEGKTFPGLIELYESAPIPVLSPQEDAIFQAEYVRALAKAERLLRGEADGEDGDTVYAPPRPATAPAGAETGEDEVDPLDAVFAEESAPEAATVRESVLDVLAAAGEPMQAKDIRTAVAARGLPTKTVANELTDLKDLGLVAKVRHGWWQIVPQPVRH